MDERHVERIARAQALQWDESPAVGSGDGSVGAYWPLGDAAPGAAATAGRADVVSVWAEGQLLNLALRPRDGNESVAVQIDLASVDEADDDLVHTLVFARVAELVASDRWARRHELAAPLVLTL
ncbi:hypothetical protein [Aeromicrobium endophyticum]|uniref:Uncharacterized protein n=1 Tax=Aeromicrobium endophyticum TaxID=2292704 RepID=A0A371PD26_9ACTN|nr:hypothetical protein [Aeromicrobium endophyticum]REK73428.1 hypothetical protein DX116_07735 [Aeromicrobium endophyticum]